MNEEKPASEFAISTPCPKSWAELIGGEAKRFCSQCELHVHNSEALTEAAAKRLTSEATERVCMRLVTDAEGTPVFADTPRKKAPSLTQKAGLALAAGGLLAACTADQGRPVTIEGGEHTTTTGGAETPRLNPDPRGTDGPNDGAPIELMGEVCLPPEDGLQGTFVDDPAPEPNETSEYHETLGGMPAPQHQEILGRMAVMGKVAGPGAEPSEQPEVEPAPEFYEVVGDIAVPDSKPEQQSDAPE